MYNVPADPAPRVATAPVPYTTTLVATLAGLLDAIGNCERSGNAEWKVRHETKLHALCAAWLPSGSGVDCGTQLLRDRSTPSRLVFALSFHHMNDAGMYDGWTEHTAVVTPTFSGVDVRITGRDRNGIKDYLAELLRDALTELRWQWD